MVNLTSSEEKETAVRESNRAMTSSARAGETGGGKGRSAEVHRIVEELERNGLRKGDLVVLD